MEPLEDVDVSIISKDPIHGLPLNIRRIKNGDPCPRCTGGVLKVQKAIELGHTFHLGTRYTEPMGVCVVVPSDVAPMEEKQPDDESVNAVPGLVRAVPIHMGCHGIGVTRLIGAVAEILADERGLNWPRVMAPYDAVVVSSRGLENAAVEVFDTISSTHPNLRIDAVLDDRPENFGWKMRDADLVGYPVIVVVGRRWTTERVCEVQCRRLQICEEVPLGSLESRLNALLSRL